MTPYLKKLNEELDAFVAKEFPGLMDGIFNSVDTNISDIIYHTNSVVNEDIYALNHEFYEGYQWIACLDSKTCLKKGTLVETPDGERKIEDLKVGDYVTGGSRIPRKVVSTDNKKVYSYLRIRLANGKTVRLTEDHKVLTKDGWIEAGELEEGDEIYACL